MFEYSPSLFSRTIQKSISPGFQFLSGVSIPSKRRTGRKLTYCRKWRRMGIKRPHNETWSGMLGCPTRSEEHTSELQSRLHLVCRLLLEKKKNKEIGSVYRKNEYYTNDAS